MVLGEIALLGTASFDNVKVSSGGHLLFTEDFEDLPNDTEWFQGTIQNWMLSGTYENHSGELYAVFRERALVRGVAPGEEARHSDETWQNFRLEVDVNPSFDQGDKSGIQIGGSTFSRFTLWLSGDLQQAVLEWGFSAPGELVLESQKKELRFAVPFPIVNGLIYRASLEAVDGQIRASVRSPTLWSEVNPTGISWTSLATVENTLVLTIYDQAYNITPEGRATPLSRFEAGVGEMRVWEGRRGPQLGVCLPEVNKLLTGVVPAGQEAEWPTFLTNTIGPAVGPPAEFLVYPLSFDVGPDGRIYVLDAGNARIVVFDSSRRYVTQWGRWGDGEGEFDFGRGARRPSGELDFAGSIAADSQGYIYVADELNKRIQKFAP